MSGSIHGYVKRNKYAIVTILSLTFLLIATYIEYVSHADQMSSLFLLSSKTWTSLFKELSFALLIALVISIGIEESSRKELNDAVSDHVKDIQRNVFNSTFGRNIPREILAEVEDLVLKADFVRSRHRAIYTLSIKNVRDWDACLPDRKVIVAEATTSYVVRNVSGVPKDFTVKIELEKPPFDDLKKYTSITSVKINDVELTNDEITDGDANAEDTDNFKKFEYTITSIRPGQEVEVVSKFKEIKMMSDVEIWRSLLPSDGMTLTLSLPKEATHWGAHALHREEARLRSSSLESRVHEWSVESGVLPHQGIVFWWRCNGDSPDCLAPSEVRALAVQTGGREIVPAEVG
ncbi:hypothetical protein JJL56_23915 [Azospirillum sp. YIM DDC1]|uniref:Uncharacterized protein n=1 Tax=Azospirillum aestuarii TaxID=2802052 RepID=A0ABS1I4J8_9PROT|nr:hypothetical protein [Azospirillum aestuarii]MBK4721905.1 hypothetical protein [Azospirillum aestuarii]